MIEVKNLTKKYGSHMAISNLSFTIEQGKIYGLLGPNGAGKSTTMNIITGCLAASDGTVLVDGHDIFEEPLEAKRHIGYLPEIPPLYTEMTPQEYLVFVSEAKGVPFEKSIREIKDVMQLTQIVDVKDRLIRNLSKGYRQRVGIAQAMIGDPDVIILDEPTVGLDPKQIIEIRDLIRRLGEKKTVIISSHILAEISAVCDHVLIISHGHLVADDTIENLENSVNRANALTLKVRGDEAAVRRVMSGVRGIVSLAASAEHGVTSLGLETEKALDIRDKIFFAFASAGLPIIEMQYRETTLENIFMTLTENEPEPQPGNKAPVAGPESPTKAPIMASLSRRRRDAKLQTGNNGVPEDDYKPLFGASDEDADVGDTDDDTDGEKTDNDGKDGDK